VIATTHDRRDSIVSGAAPAPVAVKTAMLRD